LPRYGVHSMGLWTAGGEGGTEVGRFLFRDFLSPADTAQFLPAPSRGQSARNGVERPRGKHVRLSSLTAVSGGRGHA